MFEVGKLYTVPDDIANREDLNKGMLVEVLEILSKPNSRNDVKLRYNIKYSSGGEFVNSQGLMTIDFWKEVHQSNRDRLKQGLLKEGL